MKVRLLSAVMALLVGLLAVLLLDLALGTAGGALAQEPEPCPPDFHWEQFSGQCCVQDYETLPDHARIGYTGNSICDDGYTGIYKQRATTSGLGPPGCPQYTSFAFLAECVSRGSGAGGVIGGGGAIRDISTAIYEGGSGPSPEDLATVGGAGVGVLLLTGGAILVLRPRATSWEQLHDRLLARDRQTIAREFEQAFREEKAALEELEKVRRKQWDLTSKKDFLQMDLKRWDAYLRDLEGQAGRLGRYGTLTGVMSIIFSLIGGGALPTGLSVAMSGAGILTGETGGTVQQLKDAAQQAIAEIEDRLRVADENVRKYDRVVEIAADRVRDTRGRADYVEEELRGFAGEDFWPRRERPILSGESTFDDWLAGRRGH